MTDTRESWEKTYDAIQLKLDKVQVKLNELLDEGVPEIKPWENLGEEVNKIRKHHFELGKALGLRSAYADALTYLTIPIHTNRRIPPYNYQKDELADE